MRASAASEPTFDSPAPGASSTKDTRPARTSGRRRMATIGADHERPVRGMEDRAAPCILSRRAYSRSVIDERELQDAQRYAADKLAEAGVVLTPEECAAIE